MLGVPQVKKSLFSGDERILEKNDQTPVTIADFGVQALVSLGNSNHLYVLLMTSYCIVLPSY